MAPALVARLDRTAHPDNRTISPENFLHRQGDRQDPILVLDETLRQHQHRYAFGRVLRGLFGDPFSTLRSYSENDEVRVPHGLFDLGARQHRRGERSLQVRVLACPRVSYASTGPSRGVRRARARSKRSGSARKRAKRTYRTAVRPPSTTSCEPDIQSEAEEAR
jgi:hypothetical protein